MCVMNIMNVLRTGMSMSISHIHIWLCNKILNEALFILHITDTLKVGFVLFLKRYESKDYLAASIVIACTQMVTRIAIKY